MGLDIRWPIGLMFTLIGGMLTLFGGVTHSKTDLYAGSLGININLIWGIVLLAFGLWMLIMAIRGGKKDGESRGKS